MLAELTPEIGLQIAAFLALLGVFVFPGYWIGRQWLAPERGWSAGQRCALGFVVSFGLFTALSAPFLLLRLRFEDVLAATACAWSMLVVTAIVGRWSRRPFGGRARRAEPVARQTLDCSEGAARRPAATVAAPRGVYVLGGGAMVAALAFSQEWVDRRTMGTALLGLAGAACVVFGWRAARSGVGVGAATSWGGRPPLTPPLQGGELLHAPLRGGEFWHAPLRGEVRRRLSFWPAAGLIVFAAATAAVYSREDADDTLYLSEVLAFEHAERLHLEEPTHRGEGLPANPVYWLASWELLGAILCRASGLHPMIAFHTVLPPLVVLAALALYARLLRLWLPGRMATPAFLILAGYFVVGMSSHWTANNYLLPRAWQGKAVLIHVALPAVMLLLDRLLRRASAARWLALLAATTAAMGLAACAMYLTAFLVGGMAVAYAVCRRRRGKREEGEGKGAVRGGSSVSPSAFSVFARLSALATLLPQALFGIVVASRRHDVEQMTSLVGSMSWVDQFLYRHLNVGEGGGTLELFALAALPLLVCLPVRRRGITMLLVFPVVLMLTAGNPLLYRLVAGHVTTEMGYDRIFWLVPFGPVFGVIVGCLGWSSVRAFWSCRPTVMAGVVCVAPAAPRARRYAALGSAVVGGLLVGPMLAGHYVWGSGNVYFGERPPELAANPYKIPDSLLEIARRLVATCGARAASRELDSMLETAEARRGDVWASLPTGPGRPSGRIVCGERAASLLAPLDYGFRFVYTRPYQTEAALLAAGRGDEAERRRGLAADFLQGAMRDEAAAAALAEFDARWIVAEEAPRALREQLGRLGYRLVLERRPYSLWERPP